MKVAYFGIDALAECLEYLLASGHEVIKIFTTDGDDYDRTERIRALAEEFEIPVQTTRVKEDELLCLQRAGAALTVTAGYPWKIPVTDALMQVNLHPAYLPRGRGAWPMPVAILRGEDSGVTLHRLSEKFDEGDILLQTKIPLSSRETLVTLTKKIQCEARKLLAEFLENPAEIWQKAKPQGEGEYWAEPGDIDRTIFPTDDAASVSRKLRAFAGYGCLYSLHGIPWEAEFSEEKPILKRPYFRPLKLSDRALMERIRRKYNPELSDYTFALLWCWRKQLKLSVCLGEDFFLIKGEGYYFFPVGAAEHSAEFLRELRKRETITLRFCGEREKAWISDVFPDAKIEYAEDDCDYLIENGKLCTLAGGEFAKQRNAVHHYEALTPPPVAEPISPKNLAEVAAVSELCRLSGIEDGEAEREAVKYFFELGLKGILVRRGDPVAFVIYSEKDDRTLQGHFIKHIEKKRGGTMCTIQRFTEEVCGNYEFTNIEDDLGDQGLRAFKRSLKPVIVPSYTIALEQT